jgi:hypothetical protein
LCLTIPLFPNRVHRAHGNLHLYFTTKELACGHDLTCWELWVSGVPKALQGVHKSAGNPPSLMQFTGVHSSTSTDTDPTLSIWTQRQKGEANGHERTRIDSINDRKSTQLGNGVIMCTKAQSYVMTQNEQTYTLT